MRADVARVRRAGVAWIVVALATSCTTADPEGASQDVPPPSGSSSTSDGAITTLPAPTVSVSTVPVPTASSLAESQLSASTVVRPATPPRCSVAELSVWTAQVRANGDAVDAVLRLANVGDRWCEIDISASTRLDPDIEPDVWLEPGEWAELVVGSTGASCGRHEVVTQAHVAVGDDEVVAPTTAIVPCGWSLTSFLPLDPPIAACSELAAMVSAGWLVVSNRSTVACTLGELTGAGHLGVPARRPADPPITALAPGDLAGFPLRRADDCAAGRVPLDVAGVRVVEVEIDPCAHVELGPARSVLAGSSGLLGEVELPDDVSGDVVDVVDVEAVVARLDPFASP